MLRFLLQPYPFEQSLDRRLIISLSVGLFIAFFLILFEPFGISQLPLERRWQPALFFGAISFACSAFFRVLVPALLPSIFNEQVWRTWKEVVFVLITILGVAAGVYGGLRLLYGESAPFAGFLPVFLATLQIGIFPVLGIIAFKQIILYKRYAAAAAGVTVAPPVINSEPAVPAESLTQPQTITLQGEGQKEVLACRPDALLYIESSDNYINIHHLLEGKEKTALFRGSLRKMEEQLAAHPQFFRCHRMYLVNLHAVREVTGNAQGLKLHLQGAVEPVPVSRSLTTHVKKELQALSRSPQNT